MVSVYVYDIIIISTKSEDINKFKEETKTKLQMRNLQLSYFLGIEANPDCVLG